MRFLNIEHVCTFTLIYIYTEEAKIAKIAQKKKWKFHSQSLNPPLKQTTSLSKEYYDRERTSCCLELQGRKKNIKTSKYVLKNYVTESAISFSPIALKKYYSNAPLL